MTKYYEIRAGCGSLRRSAYCRVGPDGSDSGETPFGCHDEAIDRLARGEAPQKIAADISARAGAGFSLDIWEVDAKRYGREVGTER